jgi:hypothetical protein
MTHLITILCALAGAWALAEAVAQQWRAAGHTIALAAVRARGSSTETTPATPERHSGATVDWRPLAAFAATTAAEPAAMVHAEADLEELTVRANWDAYVASWRRDPDWLTAWRLHVDEQFAAIGVYDEGHRRWRASALDSTTHRFTADELADVLAEGRRLVEAGGTR